VGAYIIRRILISIPVLFGITLIGFVALKLAPGDPLLSSVNPETLANLLSHPEILAAANLGSARRLFVTIPEPFEAGQVVQQARAINPSLEILARAHSDAAVEHLEKLGATLVVLGEREIAERMLERARSDLSPGNA